MIGAIALTFGAFALLGAGDAPLVANWVTVARDVPPIEVTMKQYDTVLFTQIVPKNAYRLASDAVGAAGEPLLAQGTIMVAARAAGVACQMTGRYGPQYVCLTDSDGDHAYDGYFRVPVASEVFLTAIGKAEAPAPLRTSVGFTSIDPLGDAPRTDIKLMFTRKGGMVTRDGFDLCFITTTKVRMMGPDKFLKFCSVPGYEVGPSKLPMRVEAYGGTITFLAKHGGRYDVRIEPPKTSTTF